MKSTLLRQRILLAIGIAGLGCEHNPDAHSPYEGSSVPPIETIAPPDPPSGKVVALPDETHCEGGACYESQACQAPLPEMPEAHYPAPFERCRIGNNFSVQITKGMRASNPETCCYRHITMHPKGRPLRHDDEAIVPAIVRGPQHLSSIEAPAHLAERFVEIARIEHSSVASFADLSLSLLAHGAPIELVEGAHRAAIDEIAHATAALEIASSIDGVARTAGPMPIPPGDRSFHALVRSTVIDGCFGEVIGALEAGAEVSEDEAISSFFRMVAEEEARHAVLAFQIVRWALGHDRQAAETAIEDALHSLDPMRTDNEVTMPCLDVLLNGRALPAWSRPPGTKAESPLGVTDGTHLGA
jgi:hypothetical protein